MDRGEQEVIEKTSLEQNCPIIYVVAQHGLQCNKHMRELVESNTEEVVYGYDNTAGLRLFSFMLAAMSDYSDLSVIYTMMRMSP